MRYILTTKSFVPSTRGAKRGKTKLQRYKKPTKIKSLEVETTHQPIPKQTRGCCHHK